MRTVRRLATAAVCLIVLIVLTALVRLAPPAGLPGDQMLARTLDSGATANFLRPAGALASSPAWTMLVMLVGARFWISGARYLAVLLVLGDLSAEGATLLAKVLNEAGSPGAHGVGALVQIAAAPFPSAHVVRVTVTLALLRAGLQCQKRWSRAASILAALFVIVVGLERIAADAHLPSGVLGGYLLAAALFNTCLAVVRSLHGQNRRFFQRG